MEMHKLQLLGVIFSLIYLAFVFHKLRRQQLALGRALAWLGSGLLLLLLSLFPGPVTIAGRWAGFEAASNALFVFWLLIMTVLVFVQSLALSKHEEQIVRLAQECAILRAKAEADGEA